jgi:dynein assembly factor with WDR repeat domains 1
MPSAWLIKSDFSEKAQRSEHDCRLWDIDTGECLQMLEGHTDEIFSCAFNYEGDFVITGSKDNTCRIWKAQTATSQPRQGYDME